jgi:hypothetical protein
MLRLIILGVLIATLVVIVRLLLIRRRFPMTTKAESAKPKVIEMPASGPLVIKHFFFANFDHRTGPPDPTRFFENLIVHVGEEDSARYRVYSLWVATPSAIKADGNGYRFGRGLLIVDRYDTETILRGVREHVRELGLLAEEVD